MSMNREIVVVLPDIRSTHNTGSFFRTGDAAGISKIIMCGITATPPHPHLMKVSLGSEDAVPWEYIEDVEIAISQLQRDGFQCIGVEQTKKSVDYRAAEYGEKIALFFGNEVDGLPQLVIDQMDVIIELPMKGMKESLNVSVAGGILLYHVRFSAE